MRLVLFILISLWFPSVVRASATYQIDYHSNYRVLPNDTVYVQHKIDLTNNLANIYPTNYTISIGTINLKNIQVIVNQIEVKPKIDLGQNYTTITFPLPQPKIGLGKTNSIQINYFNPNILEKIGSNYEINLPKLSKANETKTYLRTLIIPHHFPTHYLATPQPDKIQTHPTQTTFIWSHTPNQNITLLFGQSQTYKLELDYQLQTSQTGKLTEIALPPDTAYQQVYLEKIEPQPQFISLDADGNWLAHYQLDQLKTNHIKATVYVQVYPQPHLKLPLNDSNLDTLTKSTHYWPTHNSLIKQLAKKLQTPYNIYDYLVNNFVYNYNRTRQSQRLGALKALQNPQLAICTEFTDAFIALARSLNIPAREIEGYAYTHNQQLKPLDLTQDVLHAWPEYFDSQAKTWLAIDPTWGNTTGGMDYFHKLDFNHIVFVRHGQEDNYPLPAGAYKTDKNNKNIHLTLATQLPTPRDTFIIKNHQVINTGNHAFINKTIKLSSSQEVIIPYLPPYGRFQLNSNPSTLKTSQFFQNPNLILLGGLGSVLIVGLFFIFKRQPSS